MSVSIHKNNFQDYAKKASFAYLLTSAAKAGKDVYENEYNKLNNLPVTRQDEITIKKIFQDNWNSFKDIMSSKNIPIRESIHTNVDRMINCRNLKKGYIFYECPNCGDISITGISCHSRFCVSCGKKYRDARANEISKTCILVPHRHITWTISKSLRRFFRNHRELLNELFNAVDDVLKFLITGKSKAAKERGETLGYISTLHTFGRDLKFNPHIHTLIAECTIDKNGKKKPYHYFNYESLRKAFMNQLLKRMYRFLLFHFSDKEELNSFIKIRLRLYREYDDGFYVHAPQKNIKNSQDIKKVVNYVCRYAGHPAISETRITNYDFENKTISYYYEPHEDDAIIDENDKIGTQYVTESVYQFIAKLIVHIPDMFIHTTRYYGFYANHTDIDISEEPALYSYNEIKKMSSNQNWRKRLLASYKYDPIICHCGHTMIIINDLCYFEGYTKEDG